MQKIKKFFQIKGVVALLISVMCAFSVIISIAVFPQTVKYTVLNKKAVEGINEEYASVIKDENLPDVYTVKYVGGKVYVMHGKEKLHEVKVDYSSLTITDKKRLEEGITVDGENELLYLTQYLESWYVRGNKFPNFLVVLFLWWKHCR